MDYGGNRHGFLAFSEIHPDYYQIPVADREALMEEERAYAEAMRARDEAAEDKKKSRKRSKPAKAKDKDAVATSEIDGMETIDLGEEPSEIETASRDEAQDASKTDAVETDAETVAPV